MKCFKRCLIKSPICSYQQYSPFHIALIFGYSPKKISSKSRNLRTVQLGSLKILSIVAFLFVLQCSLFRKDPSDRDSALELFKDDHHYNCQWYT
jgi:hypothetical protein